VQAAYFNSGQWALGSGPLDATAGDDSGVGTGRPQVAACGDGVGIVTWGEAGHIYTRRVWAASVSIVSEQADVPTVQSSAEASSDTPAIGCGDDSSYAVVAWHEVVRTGGVNQDRVLSRRLRGSMFDAAVPADVLSSPGSSGAVRPRIAVGQYGSGFTTSERTDSNQLYATLYSNNGGTGEQMRLDSLANVGKPFGAPTITALYSGLVAWQETPGLLSSATVEARFYDGTQFGPEFPLSSPALGETDASRGLLADGNRNGDVALAWVQGTGSVTRIMIAQLYHPPGSFGPSHASAYVRTAQPTFAWTAANEPWGQLTYSLAVDGGQVGQTTGTSLVAPAPLADGPHTWQVIATNNAGLTSTAKVVNVWVDTVAPTVQFTMTGAERKGRRLRLRARVSDAPPPEPPASASGIASVVVSWGDGSPATTGRNLAHVYARAGRFRLTVTATDKAGNSRMLVRHLRIAAR
jgi:hypothetical protein